MKGTYWTHKKSGKTYCVFNTGKVKINGVWHKFIVYINQDGEVFGRLTDDFSNAFTPQTKSPQSN